MIVVVLPYQLRQLAGVGRQVRVDVVGIASQAAVIDALEVAHPCLRGTLRDPATGRRRPFVRFFACEQDLSNEPADAPPPEAVIAGVEELLVVGAIAGG